MTRIIRIATKEDFIKLKELFLITRRKTFFLQDPKTFQLNDYIDAVAGEEVWVAEQNGIIVGFVSMLLQDNFIHNLFVHPNWQNQGIGSSLLKHAESRLGCPMELKVKTYNLQACAFYQSHGWREVFVGNNSSDPFFTYRKDLK